VYLLSFPQFVSIPPETLGTISRIGVILLLTLISRWGLQIIFAQVEKRVKTTRGNTDRLARLQTILRLARSVTYALVLILAGLMVLQTFQINITPLLASAGVVGLALSLGTQALVKDFIGGILILVENQFDVNDVIEVGDISGSVEHITLRTTSLRDLEGKLYIIPNGEIRTVSNLSVDWSRAVVDFNLPYDMDIRQAVSVLQKAAKGAKIDPAIQDDLLEEPQAVGWVGLKDWAVQVRLMVKTRPGRQFQVAGVLRQYALEAFQAAGIEVAIPRQDIKVQGPASKEVLSSRDD
jgi:moderate conductance mechanosensitive channel